MNILQLTPAHISGGISCDERLYDHRCTWNCGGGGGGGGGRMPNISISIKTSCVHQYFYGFAADGYVADTGRKRTLM